MRGMRHVGDSEALVIADDGFRQALFKDKVITKGR